MATPIFPPVRPAPFARMPPAVFPVLMGLLGLGLALRRGLAAAGLPVGLAEIVLGAAVAIWAFAFAGLLAKIARRPGVLAEDLRILPGRAGVAAASLGLLLTVTAVAPYAPGLARGLLPAGLALHLGLAVLMAMVMLRGPAEGRVVTPVWHLMFVGFIIGAVPAPALGMPDLGRAILFVTMAFAAAIYTVSIRQLLTRVPPAPLRPLLAIHLAPPSLFGTAALAMGMPGLGAACAALGGLVLLALLARARWLTEAGFTPLWGAFTFPLAAYASLCLLLDGVWRVPGALVLVAALIAVPVITYRVLKMWAGGSLAVKTNAATA